MDVANVRLTLNGASREKGDAFGSDGRGYPSENRQTHPIINAVLKHPRPVDLILPFCDNSLCTKGLKKGEALLEAANQSALYGSQFVIIASASPGKRGSFIGLNTLSFPCQEIIRVPLKIYNGGSAFTLSKVNKESDFVIAQDKIRNGLIELKRLSNL
ncbi:Glycoside hydrolase, 38 vacuolar alpha mannosidase [Puccinia graminis f. sp. tritici]|uniref:Glycoside hydrolase, 38 vacuolar alpha mannosidase n=1 Tax=Puccinia graminis f. sp. tritici TaxID=56615 RepID=A0A5B0PY86_PUCGR|nr:Glycoside hydrolase, 38 vacuolar alpha mannosidase [Puccinia graminis f. sp. tritici]